MSTELIGFLQDEGYSPKEIRELLGPLVPDAEEGLSISPVDPGGRQQAIQDVLTVARDARRPPGPQAVVPSGVVNSLPQARGAKAMRVDTEGSYRAFRRSGAMTPEQAVQAVDTPEQSENITDALSYFSQTELMGALDVTEMRPASQTSLFDDPHATVSEDQACILCGLLGSHHPICGNCAGRMPELLGLFDRGYASQVIGLFDGDGYRYPRPGGVELFSRGYASQVIGFGERGAAASLYDPAPSATLDGDGFYRLPQQVAEYGYDGLSAIVGDVLALSVPSTVYAEEIPLSFDAEDARHITTWKQGERIYGSIRLTGWDGKNRILTATTPYAKEVGIVVGYAESARIAPTHTIAILDPLARQLGASRLLPRLAAASPGVLRVARGRTAPIILSVMPAV